VTVSFNGGLAATADLKIQKMPVAFADIPVLPNWQDWVRQGKCGPPRASPSTERG